MHFKKMILHILFLSLTQNIFSGDSQTTLFLTSDPINGTVFMNNKKLQQKTPLLLKNIDSGQHDIRIEKNGFLTIEEVIQINSGENNLYSYEMISENMFSSYQKTTEYPHQKYIDSFNIIIPVLAGFSAALTYNEISNPRYSDSLISPFIISTYAVNTAFIGTDIALHLNRKKFKEKLKNSNDSKTRGEDNSDKILYDKANKAFQEGRFDDALADYREIIRGSQDSPNYPDSLYKSAAVLMIKKDYKEASEYFLAITEKYPEADLYDKALKNLAEIYVLNKEFKKAVLSLEEMLYVNNLYTKKEIESRIKEISQMDNQIKQENQLSVRP